MPNIGGWAGDAIPLGEWSDDYDPGIDTARIVGDKTTSVVLIRDGAAQTAQAVRIEELRSRSEAPTEAGYTGRADVVLIGYKGHPTIADTDVQRGDRFAVDGVSFEVTMLVPGLVDSLQAYAKVRG